MKCSLVFALAACMCSVTSVGAQQAHQQERKKVIVVPDSEVLITVANQSGSPLRFEKVKRLRDVNGGAGWDSFKVRNISGKPIRSFTVGGAWGDITWSAELTKEPLMQPGEVITPGVTEEMEYVPAPDAAHGKQKSGGMMKAISVLMVVRVEFADGTVFDAGPTYDAFLKWSDWWADLKANAK